MKPSEALLRAARFSNPQHSSVARLIESFCLRECGELFYGMDCHSILSLPSTPDSLHDMLSNYIPTSNHILDLQVLWLAFHCLSRK